MDKRMDLNALQVLKIKKYELGLGKMDVIYLFHLDKI